MTNLEAACTRRPSGVRNLLLLLAISLITLATAVPLRAQTEQKTVAVVAGRQITQKEVDDSIASQILPLQQQIYELRKKALDNLIIRELLEAEAKKRAVSVEELRRQLTAGEVTVSPAEVEKVYMENASLLAAMSPDEARERVRLDLESQARMRNYRDAIAKLRERASVEVRLDEVRLSVAEGDDAFSQGRRGASVTIVEFSDFQCPYCRTVQGTLKRIVQSYGDNVRLVFKHLPLTDIHPQAMSSAQAAFCAGEQGAFWQYHDGLFASDDLSAGTLNKIAARVNLNLPQFQSCLNSEKARSAVLNDVQEAKRMGIGGTPAFLINGKLVSGAISFEDFRGLIEREINSAPNASASR
jgi:protein-disulfide isomerase